MSKRPYTTKLNKLGLDDRRDLSKVEEKDILITLHDAFKGTGNYLEKLFSKNLVDWASREIDSDWMPDIYSIFAIYLTRSNDKDARAEKAEERAEALERRVVAAEAEYRKLSDEMALLRGQLRTAKKAEGVLVRLTEALNEATEMVKEGEI